MLDLCRKYNEPNLLEVWLTIVGYVFVGIQPSHMVTSIKNIMEFYCNFTVVPVAP